MVPVIQGGMGIGISLGGLAGAVAACGGMGVISTANIGFRETDFYDNTDEADCRALRKEIRRAREISRGRGLLAVNAMVATTRYDRMIRTACEEGIDAIISGAGLPLRLPELAKGFDVLLAPIVSGGRAARSVLNFWRKRHDRNADFLVVEGSRAGGHLGFSRQEVTEGTARNLPQLVEEVCREAGGLPVFAAGSVCDLQDMQAVKRAGADGVQIATQFIACRECDASQGFKEVILKASEEDVTILKSPVGMPGRGLRTPLIRNVEAGERIPPERCIGCIHGCNPAETPYCINQALIRAWEGNYEEGLFFCGANVGKVTEMTTVELLMKKLAADWREA